MDAFLSTPRFIKSLTDISTNLSFLQCSRKEKKAALMEDLNKVNQQLPANVYIPFVDSSIRNYAVLHIPPNECHVFQTKERAPFLICVELYRPDELQAYTDRAMFAKYRTKEYKEAVYFETEGQRREKSEQSEKKKKTTVKEKLGKLISKGKQEKEIDEIEKLADIQISRPLFARRMLNRQNMRSFT